MNHHYEHLKALLAAYAGGDDALADAVAAMTPEELAGLAGDDGEAGKLPADTDGDGEGQAPPDDE